MVFRLQRRQRLRAQAHRLLHERDVEVGDADVAREAVAFRFDERTDRLC
jgi:hypothetical protein